MKATKRPYVKLSWGNYIGYFETPEQAQDALPRMTEEMDRDGAISFVEVVTKSPLGVETKSRLLDKWPEGERYPTTSIVEMTPEEYHAIPARNNWVIGRGPFGAATSRDGDHA